MSRSLLDARDAELAALVAEQAADERWGHRINFGHVSLDAPLRHDTSSTFAEIIGDVDHSLDGLLGEGRHALPPELEPLVGRDRGGRRPGSGRKMTEAQIRALHRVHYEQRVPMNELARRYWQRFGYASINTCCVAILRGFDALGLPRHERMEMILVACRKHGRAPKHGSRAGYKRWLADQRAGRDDRAPLCEAMTAKGKPCARRVQNGTLCWLHDPLRADERNRICAEMRGRVGKLAS